MNPRLTVADALAALSGGSTPSVRLLERPTFDVSVYKPEGLDLQRPHKRDELYVIASGTGEFRCEDKTDHFAPGDAFFVPAGAEHRFMNFSNDFWTWVVFFGLRPSN